MASSQLRKCQSKIENWYLFQNLLQPSSVVKNGLNVHVVCITGFGRSVQQKNHETDTNVLAFTAG